MESIMKKVMFLVLCVCVAGVVSADTVTVYQEAGKIGVLTYAATGYNGHETLPTDSTGGNPGVPGISPYIMAMGDIYIGEADYALGVVKLALPTLPVGAVINSAWFRAYGYFESPYVKIQRYANDNSTVLGEADHPVNASLIDVAILQQSDIDGGGDNWTRFYYDLTASVIADIAAGKTYTSYLFTAAKDAAGTPSMVEEGIERFLIADYPPDGYEPLRLEIDYTVPEPATMALLLLGGAFVRKRKA